MVDADKISFPLLFLNPQFGYSIESIIRDIHGSPDYHLKEKDFPHDIQDYIWIQEGIPGQSPWLALGILTNGLYFFYKAYMILPTGTFVKNGHMDLWLSYRLNDILQFAMDTQIRHLYLKYTQNKISDEVTSVPLESREDVNEHP